jgi:hypothetical protein
MMVFGTKKSQLEVMVKKKTIPQRRKALKFENDMKSSFTFYIFVGLPINRHWGSMHDSHFQNGEGICIPGGSS